ncbi:hypothetical protein TTHERM_00840100 (macronuclear) [Tetrahymena thermophila SB210]|uniref:Uncharacterized protein n=1 Tax=Tetrahymena thermophila (strain SB210) TaxID=312017 RepID=I7MJ40_TETTS|nr:hypothetical protein TTHERM_00840100 [Tetrahymena thermophila SB210]EAS05041.2 hypothetical protein TTHERM_00840100 [Tetrahymena thermophila SB210]|eukprot:XP_001025286.2 hypothetical protein TTHERM_00840100 [Tetrahymena thermophila SB210]
MLVDAISRSTSQVSNQVIPTQACSSRNQLFPTCLVQMIDIKLIELDYLKIIDKIEIKIYYKMVLKQNEAESRIVNAWQYLNIWLITHLKLQEKKKSVQFNSSKLIVQEPLNQI